MSTESITARFIKKIKSFFAPQIIEEEVRVLEESTPPRKYVNVLFLDMVKKRVLETDLYRDDPLPKGFEGFEDDQVENVTHAQVEGQLREMTTSTGPHGEQQIHLTIRDKKYICSVEFGIGKIHLEIKEDRGLVPCPNGGAENADGLEIGSSCSHALPRSPSMPDEKKPTKDKWAKAVPVLIAVSLILSIVSAALGSTLAVVIAASVPVVFGIISFVKIRRRGGRPKDKRVALCEIVIPVLFAPFPVLWTLDAAAIPNDYSVADLRSAPQECNRSFELLTGLSETDKHALDAPSIGLSATDVNTINAVCEVIADGDRSDISEALKANSKGIYQAWENGKIGRKVISDLDMFSEVADLTEVTALTDPSREHAYGFLVTLRRLVYLYTVYIYSEIENGNEEEAIHALIKCDSVFRKLSLNVRSTVARLTCIAALEIDIRTASFIANNPQTSDESLELLAEHFQPLHISLRNQVLVEYLTFKADLDTTFGKAIRKRPSLFKKNSALRLMRNYCDERMIAYEGSPARDRKDLSVWPSMCPNWLHVAVDSEGKVPTIYKCYNPIFSLLVGISMPVLDRVFEFKTRCEIQSDLLVIVLKKRLDEEVSLKARTYSDEYILDIESKRVFSPGPDGEAGTTDDIELPIDPEIWSSQMGTSKNCF